MTVVEPPGSLGLLLLVEQELLQWLVVQLVAAELELAFHRQVQSSFVRNQEASTGR